MHGDGDESAVAGRACLYPPWAFPWLLIFSWRLSIFEVLSGFTQVVSGTNGSKLSWKIC